MEVPHPARTVNPATKLKDSANTEVAQLSFQRKAVQDFYSQQAAASSTVANPPAPSVNVGLSQLTPQKKHTISSINGSDVKDEIIDQPVPHMFCFHLIIMLLLTVPFYSQKEACHGNHITGKEQGHDISNSWNNWCGYVRCWGEYTCQRYDFSKSWMFVNMESNAFLVLFKVKRKVQPLEIHKPLM